MQQATGSQADLARAMGKSKSYITKLKQQGRIVPNADGSYDIPASMAREAATADPARADVAQRHAENRATTGYTAPQPAADGGVGNSYQAARAVKERYLALEAKRAYEVACGQLMRADEVSSAVLDAATNMRTRLESLPDQLAVQLHGHLDENQRRAIAANLIEAALSSLAADFSKLAKP
jgi:hypothetical protein